MQFFWWSVTQAAGALGVILQIVMKELRSSPHIELSFETFLYHADSLMWFGATLTLFPIFDFLQKATRPESMILYAGRDNSIILAFCVLLLMFFTFTSGAVWMSDSTQFARLPAIAHETYAFVFLGTIVLSPSYLLCSLVRRRSRTSRSNRGETKNETT